MSRRMFAFPPAVALYTIDSAWLASSGAKTPFARVAAAGKLIVEVDGALVRSLVTAA